MKDLKKILAGLFILAALFVGTPAKAEETAETPPPSGEETADTGSETATETPDPGNTENAEEEDNTEEPEAPDTESSLSLDLSVEAPALCEVRDTDNAAHSYPESSSSGAYVAICAVQAALDNGSLEDARFSNEFPSMGLFITSLNGVTADPASQYWSLYHNDSFADLGLSSLPITAGDTIALKLFDFSGNELGDTVTIHISSLEPKAEPESESGGGGGSSSRNRDGEVLGAEIEPAFDLKKAYGFLFSSQKEDGSFGGDIYTDWTIIALAGNDTASYKISSIAKLVKYMSEHKPEGDNLTDYERRAMALMALGLDPYDTNGINYIQKIVSAFDGQQFGEVSEDNDDIFGLIALSNAGYEADEDIMQKSLAFVLGRQRENGSWDESVDMTGAALQALAIFGEDQRVGTAILKAREFLKSAQSKNGSWNDDPSSTSWALGGITAIGEKPKDWDTKHNDPLSYLAGLQEADGGIKDDSLENKIWKTAYAASAVSGKTWMESMQKFAKKEIVIAKETAAKPAPKPKTSPVTKKASPAKDQTELDRSAETAPAEPADVAVSASTLPQETKTPQADKGWLAKFLGIFGWN